MALRYNITQQKLKEIRIKLFLQNDRCRRCNCKMRLPRTNEKSFPDNMATIQHIFEKDHPFRSKNIFADITLWCFKCNREENQDVRAAYKKNK